MDFAPKLSSAASERPGRAGAAAIALLLVFEIPLAARAQQPASEPQNDRETIRQLLQRVEQLERQVQELEAERTRPSAPPAAQPAPRPEEAPQAEPHMEIKGTAPGLRIRGYTDVTFHGSDQKGAATSFTLGQLNLFITSEMSEKFKFLSEIVFEAGQDNAFGAEVERLLLQYSRNDYFNFAVGRYHTAIGYYNTAYHHSTWMQTAIGRPFLFEFEDRGGILPIHNVGVSLSGRIPSGSLGLHYLAEVGNGRASRSPLNEPVQNVVDENNRKAVNVAFFARPESLRGLQAGFSVYRDRFTPAGSAPITQTILAAHAVYVRPGFEWLNEALVIRHAPEGSPRVFHTPAFYTQISRRFGSYRPYLRYEYLNAAQGEPVFGEVGLRHGPSAGLRYDFTESLAFKLQYDHTELRRKPAVNALTTQFAFTF